MEKIPTLNIEDQTSWVQIWDEIQSINIQNRHCVIRNEGIQVHSVGCEDYRKITNNSEDSQHQFFTSKIPDEKTLFRGIHEIIPNSKRI